MKQRLLGIVAGMLLAASLGTVVLADPASLFVYSIVQIGPDYYYNIQSPYIDWSSDKVKQSYNDPDPKKWWVPADDFLIIQTNQRYNQNPAWAVQVFTDNTWLKNNKPGATYNLPDWFDAQGNFHAGGLQTAPLTSYYSGLHSIQVKDKFENPPKTLINILPKGGLVSQDGLQLAPLVWSFYDVLPFNWQNLNVVQNPPPPPNCTGNACCDFQSCNWFFFEDKGDCRIQTNGSCLAGSYWQDNFWYDVPLDYHGGQYAVHSWWPPTYDQGWTSQYLLFASNFHNAGTRQVFYTTIFVELSVL